MTIQVQKKRFEVHPYDQGIASLHRLIQSKLSKKNIELILKYDKEMVKNSLAKATRRKQLEVILMQSKMLNKDWDDVTKEDIDELVYQIIQKYSPDSGQETNSTWDHKKILKIFFRWLKFGSREYRHVGDPEETKFIRLKPVKSKIVREHLITKEDFEKLTRGCNGNRSYRAPGSEHDDYVMALMLICFIARRFFPRKGSGISVASKKVTYDNYDDGLGSAVPSGATLLGRSIYYPSRR